MYTVNEQQSVLTARDSKWDHMIDSLTGIIKPDNQTATLLYTQTFLLDKSVITGYHKHEAKKPSSQGPTNTKV